MGPVVLFTSQIWLRFCKVIARTRQQRMVAVGIRPSEAVEFSQSDGLNDVEALRDSFIQIAFSFFKGEPVKEFPCGS